MTLQRAASSKLAEFLNHCILQVLNYFVVMEPEQMYPCREMNRQFYLTFALAVDFRRTMNRGRHYHPNLSLLLELDFLDTIVHPNTTE